MLFIDFSINDLFKFLYHRIRLNILQNLDMFELQLPTKEWSSQKLLYLHWYCLIKSASDAMRLQSSMIPNWISSENSLPPKGNSNLPLLKYYLFPMYSFSQQVDFLPHLWDNEWESDVPAHPVFRNATNLHTNAILL